MNLSLPLPSWRPAICAFAFVLSACDEPSAPRERATTEAANEQKADPVADLKKIGAEVDSSRAVQTTAKEWREWKETTNAKFSETFIQEEAAKKRYFKVKGIDVQRTDSLVTPMVGYIVLEITIENPDQRRYYDGLFRVTFAWQDDEWIARNIESKDGGVGDDDWSGLYKGHPASDVLRKVLPDRVRWHLID